MDISTLIRHPEHLDKDTLYELRSIIALYPYFQTARLLMLQNLYLLHDPSFDDELRRAAVYITDREVLFKMIEAVHYQLRKPAAPSKATDNNNGSRTLSLIDNFLGTIPQEEQTADRKQRKPTPADAAVDYVAYLLESESYAEENNDQETPQLIGHNLIDNFIEQDNGKIKLNDNPELMPELDPVMPESTKDSDEGVFTETLARIYIKQGRYSKALEIIRRLSLNYPTKNAYFADQIRFLEKLIINNNKK